MSPLILFTIFFILACLLPLFKPKKKPTQKPQITTHAIANNDTNSTQLKTIFSTFDSNNDGFITLQELEISLRRLKLVATVEEVKHMMERVDLNKDGLIDYEEFCKLYESIESDISSLKEGKDEDDDDMELREAFEIFDGNGDGVITKEELSGVLISMGLNQGEKDENCRVMIQNVDLDGDGKVSFDEFKKMMIKGDKLL